MYLAGAKAGDRCMQADNLADSVIELADVAEHHTLALGEAGLAAVALDVVAMDRVRAVDILKRQVQKVRLVLLACCLIGVRLAAPQELPDELPVLFADPSGIEVQPPGGQPPDGTGPVAIQS